MASVTDFIVHDEEGNPSLLVEVKALTNRSEQWARKMHRNLVVHGRLPETQFFLLALPDHFYLWSNHSQLDPSAPPSVVINAEPILETYFTRAGVSPNQVTGATFELIVRTWLQRIVQSPTSTDLPEHSRDWMLDSGLFEAIQGGSVEQGRVPA